MSERPSILLTSAILVLLVAVQPPALKSGLAQDTFDASVRPQDDLFRHVNGGWLARTSIPPERVSYSASVEVQDKAEQDVHAVIEEVLSTPNRRRGSTAQQIADLYASIVDEGRIEALGAAPIRPELQRIDAIRTTRDLAQEAGYLTAVAAGGPFGGLVTIDPQNPGSPIVHIGQGGTLLPDRDYYLRDDPRFVAIRAKYEEYLTVVFTLAGRPAAASDAKAVLALETELAKVQWTTVESGDPVRTFNRYSLERLGSEMPGWDWMAWARPQGIDRASSVVLAQPSFFKSFAALVPKTPLATWKAWLAARFITASAPYLSRGFSDARFEFFGRFLTGQELPIPRWKRGVSLVNAFLGQAVGRLYVEKHFPPQAKARMQKLVANVIQAYGLAIREAEWLTPRTKAPMLRRLSTLTTRIGYPDRWRDYGGLVVKPDDLVGNLLRGQKSENDYRMARLAGTVDRAEWVMPPQTVNAYYASEGHEIVFPAGILQPPFFNPDADDAVNYGGIGAVIGHEIGHGLDDGGGRTESTGMGQGWGLQDEPEYMKRANLLVAQFNAYTPVEGARVNGVLTVRENLGDLGGLAIAYRAYKLSLAGKPSPVLDGLTGDQRFFMGWAQIWRSKERDDYLRQMLFSSQYPPAQFRANGPVSNIQEFYEAFGVQPGDKLYRKPDERVRIW